jgi:hypothetical protein
MTADVLAGVDAIRSRVRTAVARRRVTDPNLDDPMRGLYVTDDDVDRLLDDDLPPAMGGPPLARPGGALERLALRFDLLPMDLDLLLVTLAPDLDPRFERLYGYLHDDVTKRRATAGLALELLGIPSHDAHARSRIAVDGAMARSGLLEVDDATRPFLSRQLRVPDRVVHHLLGDDTPAPAVVDLMDEVPPAVTGCEAIARTFEAGARLVYLRERPGTAGRSAGAAALAARGLGALVLDLRRMEDDPVSVARVVAREARLVGAGVVAGPVEVLAERGAAAVRAFADLACPTVLLGRAQWEPGWSTAVAVSLDAPLPPASERARFWEHSANGDASAIDRQATDTFLLPPEAITRSMAAARLHAASAGRPLEVSHVLAGARSQNAAGLERLARRIEPAVSWDSMVLPPAIRTQLADLASRCRHREIVIDEWQMRPGGGRGRGVTALFAGDPGTGKTMAAEVIAGALGLDLYQVNLATVVDKYIGETEKNLERIFSEADGINGVILFDEADALFGKRSEVSDAHDRHANIEVAFLLQRMESFDGLAVLSTNLRANLDEAFGRRLDAIIDFPMPDEVHREVLWDRCLGGRLPRADDLDLGLCARSFELSGGSIRSIAVTVAYSAAATGRPVSMADVMRATRLEYRKLGRLVHEAEFGEWSTDDSDRLPLDPVSGGHVG